MHGRKVAVWTCTNRCNLDCKFCFGRESKEEFGTADAKAVITELGRNGVKHFVFSGGEPLLRKDIFILAAHARKKGMKTILHTNGVLVNDRNADDIARLFDAVNVPIDGASENANRAMGRGNLRHTLTVIGLLGPRTGLTVSTVATRRNLQEVPKIAKLLAGLEARNRKKGPGPLVDKWRVFRFMPKLGAAAKNAPKFAISTSEFSRLEAKVKGAEFVSQESGFESSYWLISSDGTIDI